MKKEMIKNSNGISVGNNCYSRNGISLKYVLSKHSSALARFFGSYMNKKLSNRKPALDNHENFCLILLYGCDFSVKFFNAGNDGNSGQIAVDGVPKKIQMFFYFVCY